MNRLVIFAPNWLGDAVMALPAIADVRRASPDVRIAVMGPPAVAQDGVSSYFPWRMRGTNTGPIDPPGFAATGRSVDIHGVDVARIVDGQIVEYFYHEDTFGLFRQLGRFPANHSDVAGTIQDASVNA